MPAFNIKFKALEPDRVIAYKGVKRAERRSISYFWSRYISEILGRIFVGVEPTNGSGAVVC